MKKFIKILLSLFSLIKSWGFSRVFSATKFEHLKIVDEFKYQNVLVLAPHPDDDAFGLGGTLRRFADSSAQIATAYFCDGSGGVDVGEKPDQTLVEARKTEATRANEVMGVKRTVFFGYRDGRLAAGEAAVKALMSLIQEVKPDIIFVPSFLDNHPDHRVVNEILINAIAKIASHKVANRPEPEIWAYEVWTPIFPNRIVSINETIEAKKQAMAAHTSQLKARGYDKAVLGLNAFRAEINNLSGYAEAFWATTPEIYQAMYKES